VTARRTAGGDPSLTKETHVSITRKNFLLQLVGSGWVLTGCGGGGGDSAGPAPAAGSCAATIAANHGHVLTIAQADLASTVDKTYDIQGGADHTHTVTFTAAMLASLKAGNSVTATTTTAVGHDHTINERCV
jgi:hypothetical protein